MRVWLSQLIIAALLVWFVATFAVGPLPADPLCVSSHPRLTLQLVSDAVTGGSLRFGVEIVCDQYRLVNPTPSTPWGNGPWGGP